MKTKILITIQGGTIQSVISNAPNVEYVVVDCDKRLGGESLVLNIQETPVLNVFSEFYTLFNDANNPQEMEVREELKRIKF